MLSVRCAHEYPGGFSLDVDFKTEGTVTALFGPSGSGKTSILEMIAGLRAPQQGMITLDDNGVLDTENDFSLPIQQRNVGVVFQDQLLFPHLSVEKNLRYGERRSQDGNSPISFDRVVEVLELRDRLAHRPDKLSGGERQRVALGRALLSGPEFLLLDEPLTALDESLRSRVLSYLERVVEEWQLPTLFVSHAQAEVRRFADWVVVMDAGRVVTEGAPEEALAAPGPMAFTGGSGPMNLLRVESIAEHDGVVVGQIGDQPLQLPPAKEDYPGTAFVEFAPDSVLLSAEDIDRISARNHLRGTVRQIVSLPEGCFVGVDVGQIIWAEVTPAAIADLGLEKGKQAMCLIKTHSLRVVD